MKPRSPRTPVTRARALEVAMKLADAGGIGELSMRKLADALGIEAMSLYHHVASKEALLDGMVDRVFAEIELPEPSANWRDVMRRRTAAVRDALQRHPWALHFMDSRRTPGPATLAHHNAVIGCLRAAGFSVALTAHAYAVLDSFLYGFLLTEQSLPFQTADEAQQVARKIFAQLPTDTFPHLAELALEHVLKPGYTYAAELPFGLELVLEGLERARKKEQRQQRPVGRRRARTAPSRRRS